MLIRMVRNAVFWGNALPLENSATGNYTPRYIIEGRHIDYHQHIRIPFGAYAQVHEEHDNSMSPRTVGAVCLGPTGNNIGTHYFLSLHTGRIVHWTFFTELPMPDDVIQRVSDLGKQQGMPRTLTFTDRYGHELHDQEEDTDDDHDSTYIYEPMDDVSLANVSLTSDTTQISLDASTIVLNAPTGVNDEDEIFQGPVIHRRPP